MQPHTHRVPPGTPPERLDRYAARHAEFFASTAQAHRAAKKGLLRLNDDVVSPGRRVRAGDTLTTPAIHGPPRRVFEHPLAVHYEDESLAVVEKPPGLLVNGNRHRTLERALPFNLVPTEAADALVIPRPVHRLDVPTGGLVLVAKTAGAVAALGRMLAEGQVEKRYRALVVGALKREGRIEDAIDGRAAASRYAAVTQTRSLHCDWLTTVDLWPETGRTHQLRRHLAGCGHPILGDAIYGRPGSVLRRSGLFLRAVSLRFSHPITGVAVAVEIPEAPKFAARRTRETRRWARVLGSDVSCAGHPPTVR